MKARGLLGSLIFGVVGTLILQFLPSGAGQHFGIIGDYVHTGALSAQAAPGGVEVSASFANGLGVKATDDLPPTGDALTFVGRIRVTTSLGTDEGCVTQQDLQGPPVVGSIVADPLLEHAHVQAMVQSTRFPGSVISVDLTFQASSNLAPYVAEKRSPSDPTFLAELIGVARMAIVSGSVNSAVVGGGLVSSTGVIARGAELVVNDSTGCPIQSL